MSDLTAQVQRVLALHRRHDDLETTLYVLQCQARKGQGDLWLANERLWPAHDQVEREILETWALLPEPVAALLRQGETDVATLVAAAGAAHNQEAT